MKDLNCRSPEIFNIRHTDRGVRTRNTKRKGGNIHCIMAFRRVQESFTFFNSMDASAGGIDHVDSGETVSLSEVEDLDSSDSDFPDLPEKSESQSKTLPDLGIDLSKIDIPDIKTITSPSNETEVVTQTDQLEIIGEPASSGLRRSGTFTKEAPTIRVEVRRLPSTDSESSNVDDSAANPEHSDNTRPHLLVASISAGDEERGDSSSPHVRRSGTFTKDAPTIHVQKTRLSSSDYDTDSDTNLEPVNYGLDTDGGLERRSTFTKHSPTVQHNNDTDSSDDGSLQKSKTFNKNDAQAQDVENCDGLEKSRTYIKDDRLCPQGGDESMAPSGLRRSGTFTKKKPNVATDEDGTAREHSKADSSSEDEKIARSEHFQTGVADISLAKTRDDDIDLDETLKASDFLSESDTS